MTSSEQEYRPADSPAKHTRPVGQSDERAAARWAAQRGMTFAAWPRRDGAREQDND